MLIDIYKKLFFVVFILQVDIMTKEERARERKREKTKQTNIRTGQQSF